MVVKRKISKRKYIFAALLTILIFSFGLSLGMVINNERFNWIEKVNNEQEVNYQSLQFQYLYVSELEQSNESCRALSATLEKTVAELSDSLEKFVEYNEKQTIANGGFKIIARRYLLDNLKYWIFVQKAREACNDIDQVDVLYFYSEDNCDTCPDQGVLLTYYKKLFKENLLIFPIDVELSKDEAMVNLLMKQFDVETLPSIVINNQAHSGVIDKEELGSLICSSFKKDRPECRALRKLNKI
ncbi:hypothetical protein ACFLYT_01785 [Nanoarchaeota archaeon]